MQILNWTNQCSLYSWQSAIYLQMETIFLNCLLTLDFFFFFFNNMNNNMNCSLFTCSESVCPSIAYSSKAGFLFWRFRTLFHSWSAVELISGCIMLNRRCTSTQLTFLFPLGVRLFRANIISSLLTLSGGGAGLAGGCCWGGGCSSSSLSLIFIIWSSWGGARGKFGWRTGAGGRGRSHQTLSALESVRMTTHC
jgi:hypothetical protein